MNSKAAQRLRQHQSHGTNITATQHHSTNPQHKCHNAPAQALMPPQQQQHSINHNSNSTTPTAQHQEQSRDKSHICTNTTITTAAQMP
jgi:hypothetical protein